MLAWLNQQFIDWKSKEKRLKTHLNLSFVTWKRNRFCVFSCAGYYIFKKCINLWYKTNLFVMNLVMLNISILKHGSESIITYFNSDIPKVKGNLHLSGVESYFYYLYINECISMIKQIISFRIIPLPHHFMLSKQMYNSQRLSWIKPKEKYLQS